MNILSDQGRCYRYIRCINSAGPGLGEARLRDGMQKSTLNIGIIWMIEFQLQFLNALRAFVYSNAYMNFELYMNEYRQRKNRIYLRIFFSYYVFFEIKKIISPEISNCHNMLETMKFKICNQLFTNELQHIIKIQW